MLLQLLLLNLSGIGMQKVKPVCIHITVNAYLFPLSEGGLNSPIISIDINFIGAGLVSKLVCYI